MTASRFRFEYEATERHYTNLFASFNEEDDGCYAVQLRLYDEARPVDAAFGEKITDSLETASMLVEALAAEFSIPQARIKIEIRMSNMRIGTRH